MPDRPPSEQAPNKPGLPPDSSEETNTARQRAEWWNERVGAYVASRGGVSAKWQRQTTKVLRRMPRLFSRLGYPDFAGPHQVTVDAVRRLRDAHELSQNTRPNYVSRLHGFLRFAKAPIADDPDLWRIGAGKPVHRRWLTLDQVNHLMATAEGDEKIVIALGSWNGLRPVEMVRLRWRDVNLDMADPTLHLMGKGKHGGKERTIAMNPLARNVLLPFSLGKRGDAPVLDMSRVEVRAENLDPEERASNHLDKSIRAIGKRAGIVVSGYDQRRSFGRIAYYEFGIPLVSIQAIYGHASVDQTSHYIGVPTQAMSNAMQAFAKGWGERTPTPLPSGVSTIS